MFNQNIVHDQKSDIETDFREDVYFGDDDNLETSHVQSPQMPLLKKPGWQRFLQNLSQKKERNLPVWLRDVIGWGGFVGILGSFLGIQIYLNGMLDGLSNQLVLGMSGVLEISLLWLWDLYWY